MIRRKTKILLDEKFSALSINLENNYKDLAWDALKDLQKTVEELKEDGSLNEKDYNKVKNQIDTYAHRMEGYHH